MKSNINEIGIRLSKEEVLDDVLEFEEMYMGLLNLLDMETKTYRTNLQKEEGKRNKVNEENGKSRVTINRHGNDI